MFTAHYHLPPRPSVVVLLLSTSELGAGQPELIYALNIKVHNASVPEAVHNSCLTGFDFNFDLHVTAGQVLKLKLRSLRTSFSLFDAQLFSWAAAKDWHEFKPRKG